jgi:hypothetical protein
MAAFPQMGRLRAQFGFLHVGRRHEARHRRRTAEFVSASRAHQTKRRNQRKKLGIFYRESKSFLHFHEDPAGLFADLDAGSDFDRYPVNTERERQELLLAIDRALD